MIDEILLRSLSASVIPITSDRADRRYHLSQMKAAVYQGQIWKGPRNQGRRKARLDSASLMGGLFI
jgi:hypothetical protein